MKIAIFNQFMDNIGGAEIVCLYLARGLNADIYTTNIDQEKIKKMNFEDVLPRIKSIGRVPIQAPFRQQFCFMKFRHLDLKNKYDFFIIGGDWAISGAVNNKPNLEYFHSPLNEIWELKDEIKNSLKLWQRPLYEIWVNYNRFLYRRYFKHVERRVCNSKNTQNRLRKYLKKDAIVVYPLVDISKYKYARAKNFWLSVNRLSPPKRIDMQIQAFSKIPSERLIIIGSYEKGAGQFENYKSYLENILPNNVKILHWVDDKKLIELYSTCKCFITTAKDEDFGMTPIEAMASGKPAIAVNEGGYKETVINGKTGFLIDDINSDKLAEAIKKMDKELKKSPDKYKRECIKQAKRFDLKIFIKKIKCEINKQK